jgi:REP element-mobilizing transposase RayT
VFSTKYRKRLIAEKIEEPLYEYIGGIIRKLNGRLVEIGGAEDHIHILCFLPASKSVSDCVRDIKANSSKWLNESHRSKWATKFQWQAGFGAFTVSYSQIESVQVYVQNQKTHHATKSFRDEYIELLERHDIEFDMKYVFENEHVG